MHFFGLPGQIIKNDRAASAQTPNIEAARRRDCRATIRVRIQRQSG